MADAAASADARIAVVLPCFRVSEFILDVLARIPAAVHSVYVVDDCCPEQTGELVRRSCDDPRVTVLRNERQLGVGGATIAGYRRALEDGARVIVKLDGDGQMDPALVPRFVAPILDGEADYTKGNRFYRLSGVRAMPRIRIVGNALLSFLTKLSSGYWHLFDPTNGLTALHASVARELPFDKVANGFFFESDMLFRLSTLRAVVVEIPMTAVYGEEESNLRVGAVMRAFLAGHVRNLAKRIFYNYFLRSFNIASVELVLGVLFLGFGVTIGAVQWTRGAIAGEFASSGTVMLSALPVIVGVQLLLAFLSYDMQDLPRTPLHLRLGPDGADGAG